MLISLMFLQAKMQSTILIIIMSVHLIMQIQIL